MITNSHQYGRPLFSAWYAKHTWISSTTAPRIGIGPSCFLSLGGNIDRSLPGYAGRISRLAPCFCGGRVERHCGPDQRFEGTLVDLLALADVDRAPHLALEA